MIVSTDKDLMQLVSDRVCLLDTMKDRRIGPAEVEERFGVPPERLLDVRALEGKEARIEIVDAASGSWPLVVYASVCLDGKSPL